MKKSLLIINILLFTILTSIFIYSITLPDDSDKITFIFVLASILGVFYSLLMLSTLSFFILIKLKSFDHIERWIRDLRRIGLTSNLWLYDMMKSEIEKGDFTIENTSIFFLFVKGQNTKKVKDFNRKIVMNSILNFETSLKNGFPINKTETLQNRLYRSHIKLSSKEFNKFTLYFIFEYFTKYGKYVETKDEYTKYINKIL